MIYLSSIEQITKPWREIFDPTAQIFLNSTVTHQKELTLNIEYKLNPQLTEDEFIDILNRSTLGERRHIEDKECMRGMLKNADIVYM